MVQRQPQDGPPRRYLESKSHSDHTCANAQQRLRLALLGCETNEPYGPIHHTGELFLSLLEQASEGTVHIRIDLYNAKDQDYPDDWHVYDGIILPGSFSAAYDTDAWILKLKELIQKEIVTKQIPTLGICFGHQVLAHSFASGLAAATPSGARGGRYTMTTQHNWIDTSGADLYFTHGDMVAKLPEIAVCLGGDDPVPIQAAAYFGTIAEKEEWIQRDGNNTEAKPFAVTFQAHPEYATSIDLGVERTLCGCLRAQASRAAISNEKEAVEDSTAMFEKVKGDSIRSMSIAMRMLGWR